MHKWRAFRNRKQHVERRHQAAQRFQKEQCIEGRWWEGARPIRASMMLAIQICQRQVIVLLLSGKVCTYKKRHSIYRVRYCLQFQACAGDLGTCSPQIRGTVIHQRILVLEGMLEVILSNLPILHVFLLLSCHFESFPETSGRRSLGEHGCIWFFRSRS